VRLFSSVPSRCIVLLEDIDAAGLKRADELKKKRLEGEEMPEEKQQPGRPKKPTISISLSGLLNAIDGVASSEGRILIMTTNKPKDLDQALIRPGRVDLHISFTLPQREEMVEMFLSMYSGLENMAEKPTSPMFFEAAKNEGEKVTGNEEDALEPTRPETVETVIQKEELEQLAEKFADELPKNQLSLAAVQGYLLRHKHDPRAAATQAKVWGEDSLKTMEDLEC
jgi:chaperone BCS1